MTVLGKFLNGNLGDVLEIEGVPVPQLVEEIGSPLFILSENTIRHNFRRLHGAFSKHYPNEVIVCATGVPPGPVSPRSGGANAIISLSRWFRKPVRPVRGKFWKVQPVQVPGYKGMAFGTDAVRRVEQ